MATGGDIQQVIAQGLKWARADEKRVAMRAAWIELRDSGKPSESARRAYVSAANSAGGLSRGMLSVFREILRKGVDGQ